MVDTWEPLEHLSATMITVLMLIHVANLDTGSWRTLVLCSSMNSKLLSSFIDISITVSECWSYACF